MHISIVLLLLAFRVLAQGGGIDLDHHIIFTHELHTDTGEPVQFVQVRFQCSVGEFEAASVHATDEVGHFLSSMPVLETIDDTATVHLVYDINPMDGDGLHAAGFSSLHVEHDLDAARLFSASSERVVAVRMPMLPSASAKPFSDPMQLNTTALAVFQRNAPPSNAISIVVRRPGLGPFARLILTWLGIVAVGCGLHVVLQYLVDLCEEAYMTGSTAHQPPRRHRRRPQAHTTAEVSWHHPGQRRVCFTTASHRDGMAAFRGMEASLCVTSGKACSQSLVGVTLLTE